MGTPREETMQEIADAFLTKNRETIIGALQQMMHIQTGRLQMGLAIESEDGVLSSKVSGLMNSMFSNAIKIAKLVDPRASDQIQLNVGVQVNNGPQTSNELVSRAFIELCQSGFTREEITPELVQQHIAGQLLAGPTATIVDVDGDDNND